MALVDDVGEQEAVSDHDLPGLEGGPNDFDDELGTRFTFTLMSDTPADLLLRVYTVSGRLLYTRTERGAVYSIGGCPMHEEPLHLIPHELRNDFMREYGIYIEGDLCPHCRFELDNTHHGHIERVPVRRVVFSSSTSVYGSSRELPTSESMPPDPISPYGVAKLAAERYCISFSRVYHSLEAVVLRRGAEPDPDEDSGL